MKKLSAILASATVIAMASVPAFAAGINSAEQAVLDKQMCIRDRGSIAHATMLGRCGIIKQEEADDIVQGLKGILAAVSYTHLDVYKRQLQQYLSGNAEFDSLQMYHADINRDGKINVQDVTALQNALSE